MWYLQELNFAASPKRLPFVPVGTANQPQATHAHTQAYNHSHTAGDRAGFFPKNLLVMPVPYLWPHFSPTIIAYPPGWDGKDGGGKRGHQTHTD